MIFECSYFYKSYLKLRSVGGKLIPQFKGFKAYIDVECVIGRANKYR